MTLPSYLHQKPATLGWAGLRIRHAVRTCHMARFGGLFQQDAAFHILCVPWFLQCVNYTGHFTPHLGVLVRDDQGVELDNGWWPFWVSQCCGQGGSLPIFINLLINWVVSPGGQKPLIRRVTAKFHIMLGVWLFGLWRENSLFQDLLSKCKQQLSAPTEKPNSCRKMPESIPSRQLPAVDPGTGALLYDVSESLCKCLHLGKSAARVSCSLPL